MLSLPQWVRMQNCPDEGTVIVGNEGKTVYACHPKDQLPGPLLTSKPVWPGTGLN